MTQSVQRLVHRHDTQPSKQGSLRQVLVTTDQVMRLGFQSKLDEMVIIAVLAINSRFSHIHPKRAGIEVVQQAFTAFQADVAVKFGSVDAGTQLGQGGL